MSEFSLLERQLSKNSQEIAKDIHETNNHESILIALNAIRVAYYSNRINDDEKLYLKNYVKDSNIIIDNSILNKLDEGERIALLSVSRATNLMSSAERSELLRLRKRYREEEKQSSPVLIDAVNNGICCVCGDEKAKYEGITCTEGHFFCNSDLTAWVSSINTEKELDPDLFRRRKGRINCPQSVNMNGINSVMCPAECYSHAVICQHIVDEDVLEKYIEGIKHIQGLELFTNYQLQVLNEIENLKAEMMIDTPSDETDNSNTLDRLYNIKRDRQKLIERQAKKIELMQLAKTLKVLHPTARQCLVCGFGPLLKYKCDDILTHHLTHSSPMNDSSPMYNNSCPQCNAAPPNSWLLLPLWNGKLPASYLSEEINDVEILANFSANSYSWSEFLQEFLFFTDDIAKQCENNICSKTKFLDIDSMFKCKQEGMELVVMLAEIEIEERRLELMSAKLISTLDVMFKVMDSFNIKSSSSIKSLINKKELLFKIIPNTGGTDILDYLDINCVEIESISKTCSDNDMSNENDSILSKFDTNDEELIEIENMITGDLLTLRERDYLLSKAYIPINQLNELEEVAIEDVFYLQHKMSLSLKVTSLISPSLVADSPFIEIDRNALNAILEKLPSNSDSIPTLSYSYNHDAHDDNSGDNLNASFTKENHPSHYDISERLQAVFPMSIGNVNATNLFNFIKENLVISNSKLISCDSHGEYRGARSTISVDNTINWRFNDWMDDSALLTNPNTSDLDWAKPSIDMSLTYAMEKFLIKPFFNFQKSTNKFVDSTATNAPLDSRNDLIVSAEVIFMSDTNTPQVPPQVTSEVTNISSIEDIIDEDLERFAYREGIVFISPKCFGDLRSFIEDRIKDIIDIAEFDSTKSNNRKQTILAADIQRALRESLTYPSVVVFGYGIEGLRHLWYDFIFKVLKQIHPSMSIRVKAAAVIEDLISWNMLTILNDSNQLSQGLITEYNVISSLKRRYSGELFKHAVCEINKAITKYSTHHKTWYINNEGLLESESPVSITKMTGLMFDVHVIYQIIRKLYPNKFKITVEGLIAIAASIEYIVAEVLELSGNCCHDIRTQSTIVGSKSIDTRDVYLAVANDAELNVLFENAIFMNSGYLNHENLIFSTLSSEEDSTTTFDLLLENISDENEGRLIIDARVGVPHVMSGKVFDLFEQLSACSRTRLKYQAQRKQTSDLNEMMSSFDERNILSRLKRIRRLHRRERGLTDYCVSYATWRNLIKKYFAKSGSNNDSVIVTEEAYRMVATAVESQLVRLLSKSNDLANHANRIIVLQADVTKAIRSLTRRTG